MIAKYHQETAHLVLKLLKQRNYRFTEFNTIMPEYQISHGLVLKATARLLIELEDFLDETKILKILIKDLKRLHGSNKVEASI